MPPRKAIFFTLAGLNSIASAYFFNYLFFLLKQRFGFGDRENLLISALHGFVYVFAAWQGGRFAERRGFLTSLRIGFAGMALVLIAGSFLQSVTGLVVTIICWTATMLFTWPALEALVSHGENDAGLQRRIGTYNCVWAASCAVAYFSGGAIFEWLGPRSIYWLPAGIYLAQFAIVMWLARWPELKISAPMKESAPHTPEPEAYQQPVNPQAFLKMAWLVNPFAYIAINSVLPVIPHVADKLHLTVTQSGLFCSLWFFMRLGPLARASASGRPSAPWRCSSHRRSRTRAHGR
ncbi:MAG: MFS transporter [Verrucomicrobia bacterium]|nr:MFS transporter [Verrucomicrobiota bacterium]